MQKTQFTHAKTNALSLCLALQVMVLGIEQVSEYAARRGDIGEAENATRR